MNKDQVKGRGKEVAGKIKEVTGKTVGNKDLEIKGNAEKNAGKARADLGDVKNDIKNDLKNRH